MEIVFKSEKDITDQWLNYLENKGRGLEDLSELQIENSMDVELINPLMNDALAELNGAPTPEEIADAQKEALVINSLSSQDHLLAPAVNTYRSIKRKIRRVFCTIVDGLSGLGWKDILKKLLIALFPVFLNGIPAIVLPIIIAIVALYVKKGTAAVCPA